MTWVNYFDKVGVMERLNTLQLRIELAKIDKSRAWLARQLGFSRQYLTQLVQAESTKYVGEIAYILDIDKEDLIRY